MNPDQGTEDVTTALNTHPTILLFIEDLRRQRNPILRLLLPRHVLSHPLPVVFIPGDVQFLKVYFIGFQKAHHFLLFLPNLVKSREKMIIIVL